MNAEQPLFWHQGLFLQPQHFQQSERYHDFVIQSMQRHVQPHFWGVTRLQVQQAALGNKSLEITEGAFIFPDGACVVYPGNALLRPRSFDEAWVEAEKPFTVYIGLRKWSPDRENVTVAPSLTGAPDPDTRFVTAANPEEVRDLHAGGPAAQVKRLSYVLRIFWETERAGLDNYHLIPIGQLERSADEIRLSRRFVPPCPTLDASDWLINTVKDIRDQITSRSRQLEEYKSPREVRSMEFDLGYMVFLLALRSLNRYVPQLYQITETRQVHPWAVYGVLRQLIGELSTFSDNLTATGERPGGQRVLPAYDHENLWWCFSTAHQLVGELLDGITVGPGHLIRLEYDGTYFTGQLPDRIFGGRHGYWLSVQTEAEKDFILSEMEHVAKLSPKKHLTTLITRAVPGLPLEYFPVPPPGLPRRANSLYFRIDHTSTLWLDVESTKILSLFWDTAPSDLKAELVVLGS